MKDFSKIYEIHVLLGRKVIGLFYYYILNMMTLEIYLKSIHSSIISPLMLAPLVLSKLVLAPLVLPDSVVSDLVVIDFVVHGSVLPSICCNVKFFKCVKIDLKEIWWKN